MTTGSHKLEWCIVRLGKDMNWWVEEISDPVSWDIDGLGIVDPRQAFYILDLLDPMREYGLKDHCVEEAFFKFKIDKDLGEGRIRIVRVHDPILETEDPLFILPDIIDDEKGPYADFLDHVTKIRVKMLNDLIDFKRKLTEEELEEEIREEQQCHFLEGKAIHPFKEVADILEYVPDGFELDLDKDSEYKEFEETADNEFVEEVIPEFEDEELIEEDIEEDETMRWDDEEEEEELEDEFDSEEFEDEPIEDDFDEKPTKKRQKK